MKFVSYILCLVSILICQGIQTSGNHGIDVIIFSKDRPMQLYALLESYSLFVRGINECVVIYHAAREDIEQEYATVRSTYPFARFVRQSAHPRSDFKHLVRETLSQLSAEYVMFAVDDIVVIDKVDLERCVDLLKTYKGYGFYLRLGRDITYCYTERIHTGLPSMDCLETGVYRWQFAGNQGDWGYPHTVDMTIYKKADIASAFNKLSYSSPNTLEGIWATQKAGKSGLCFERSKIVNLPLNQVQSDFYGVRISSNKLDVEDLLRLFKNLLKINVPAMYQLPHQSPHIDYAPQFIER